MDRRALVDLVQAQLALLRAQWRVRRHPIGSLAIRGTGASAELDGDPARARALALALERAAEHGVFRPLCLVRSLALRDLLDRHGVAGSEIRIGVRTRNGTFAAHAWVRWGDEILGDRAWHVASFTEVDDIRVLEHA